MHPWCLEVRRHLMSAEESSLRAAKTARVVRYSGAVQGVGFRVMTVRIAARHPVVGYVRNLHDGRVELYAEGVADAVVTFLRDVRTYWGDNIVDEQIEERTPTGNHKRFEIVR
jgi:acylphosphatase